MTGINMNIRKALNILIIFQIIFFLLVSCEIRDPNRKYFGLEVTRDPDGEVVFIIPKKDRIILARFYVSDLEDYKRPEIMWDVSNSSLEWKTHFRYGEKIISNDFEVGIPAKKLIKGHRYHFGAIGNMVRGEEEEIQFVY